MRLYRRWYLYHHDPTTPSVRHAWIHIVTMHLTAWVDFEALLEARVAVEEMTSRDDPWAPGPGRALGGD